MKNISILVLVSLFASLSAFSQKSSIEVTVKNIKDPKGTLRIGLFNSEKDFLKTPLDAKIVKAEGKEVTVVFDNLAAGDYAVSVIHDENGNEKLDSNAMGIPKEGFAFGNNASGTFGPPSYKDSKVTVADKSIVQVLTLKYY